MNERLQALGGERVLVWRADLPRETAVDASTLPFQGGSLYASAWAELYGGAAPVVFVAQQLVLLGGSPAVFRAVRCEDGTYRSTIVAFGGVRGSAKAVHAHV